MSPSRPAHPSGRSTRDRILDAFEALLGEQGSRAATLDQVAATAEVSKGGLLYHFPSRDDLVVGMLDRLADLGRDDTRRMRESELGAVEFFIATSTYSGTDLDRAIIAAARIAQDSDERASRTLDLLRGWWREVLVEQTGDDDLASAVLLLGDALYFNEILGLGEPATPDAARAVLRRLGALPAAD